MPGEEGRSNEVLIELRPAESKLHVHLTRPIVSDLSRTKTAGGGRGLEQCSGFAHLFPDVLLPGDPACVSGALQTQAERATTVGNELLRRTLTAS